MLITRKRAAVAVLGLVIVSSAVGFLAFPPPDVKPCWTLARHGLRPIADDRAQRFQGKVQDFTAECRGPSTPSAAPWVDWSTYWGTADANSKGTFSVIPHLGRNGRGVDGALLDLEYQRIELIKFNLFDNYTFEEYSRGRDGLLGPVLSQWSALRLPPDHPNYAAVGGAGDQACRGELIRYRTLNGVCNDVYNPLMGSSGTLFARNVQFEQTYPDLGLDPHARNRHGDRLALLKPDPQVISRVLFTREQPNPEKCNLGQGLPNASADASCAYQPAPFFNVLAAFWIQFMTHDWFSHLEEGHNRAEQMPTGCSTQRVGNVERALTPAEIAVLGCRPTDRIDKSYIAQEAPAPTFTHNGKTQLARAQKTTRNNVTAWWDASQIYGYDNTSVQRVKRDPSDPAKLLMEKRGNRSGAGERLGYLPMLAASDPMNPEWAGQEAVAFPDNWSIGMSFYHNLFVREHNVFVDAFRAVARNTPTEDSGLRNPAAPDRVIRYRDVTAEELYQAGRLVVAAEIAKIHTTEWTTQLLYDEVLYKGMNANWHGLFRGKASLKRVTGSVAEKLNESESPEDRALWYGIFASGSGIFGLGSHRYEDRGIFGLLGPGPDKWSLDSLRHVNGGVNHFGSPFNFPEEFVTVYRLHPLVPDLIEFRDYQKPNDIPRKIPVIETFRAKAFNAMNDGGLPNWALSMGRQRLGVLALQNHPMFLQNVPMGRLKSPTNLLDVPALDIIRDRERGVPRFNEFRRQYGLRTLTSFDDFIDRAAAAATQDQQRKTVASLRQIYGQHICDASKVITTAQLDVRGDSINDCLGSPNGTLVDNIEDVDVVVGWLAEQRRPHGFAISETQFTVFIINASRRLFSDRFFTSSFRPEFYTQLGVDWVTNNGPARMMERGRPNGHKEEVSPLKRIMLRTMPELADELAQVVNIFDPWARDRGSYYTLDWKPRPGAEADPAFSKQRQ